MPKYSYNCKKCGKRFSYVLRMEDEKPTVCEECGGGLFRDYSSIGLDTSSFRNDPHNASFWKKGKTDEEIASVLSGEEKPY